MTRLLPSAVSRTLKLFFAYSSLIVALAFVLGVTLARAEGQPDTVRIGYQKSSTLITVLKAKGTLEAELGKLGVKVQWNEFTSGVPLLEALNIGAVDLSADVADTVPVFAQAAGAKLTFVAQEAPSPTAQAIVVAADSPIKTVADLQGKKVAVTKGAGAHYLLIASLERAGLEFKDIKPAYLTPADGRAAFENKSVDAWVIWDPFLSAVQRQASARVLSNGVNLAQYQRYYLASNVFVAARPDVIAIVYAQLREAGKWVKSTPAEAAALLAPVWGLDVATVEQANSRRSYDVRAATADNIAEQQKIADTFFAQGLLPKAVKATDVNLWKPDS